jgi:hypothetical protein
LCVSHFLFPYCAFGAFFFPVVHFVLSFSPLCVSHFLLPHCVFGAFFLFPHCAFGVYESVIFCLDFDPFFFFFFLLLFLCRVFFLYLIN